MSAAGLTIEKLQRIREMFRKAAPDIARYAIGVPVAAWIDFTPEERTREILSLLSAHGKTAMTYRGVPIKDLL